MAGHSKWANTKHRKAAQDAKRGKIFTKIIRELVASTKLGGGDPASNPRLRTAIDKALLNNMARDTINKAISRGAGGEDGTDMETMVYEGYGPGGTAVMVECLSDNRNRTVSEVRHAFSKVGGNLGTEGSVSYLFLKRGIISYQLDHNDDAFMEAAINIGVEDITVAGEGEIEIFTSPESFSEVRDGLHAVGFVAQSARVSFVPTTKVNLDIESAPKLLRLIDLLEDCDDVQEIYHNGEFLK